MKNLDYLPIEFPSMRGNLLDYVFSLSNYQYQQKYWGKTLKNNPNFYDNFDEAIHYLYDTLQLDQNPQSWLGLIFLNDKEINLSTNLIEHLEILFSSYGLNLSDNEYM